MYLHPQQRMRDTQALHEHLRAHPLGAWVCTGEQGLQANHLPFLLESGRGPQGTLWGHVSRANPVWPTLAEGRASVVMFMGPQAYITPNWYPGKAEHGQVVPTWNYVAVHAHGHARAFTDRAALLRVLHQLTHAQEQHRAQPWQMADAPQAYLGNLLDDIVGIEISLERLEGRRKASQDEALADRLGTVAGLQQQGSAEALAMAAVVQKAIGEPGGL